MAKKKLDLNKLTGPALYKAVLKELGYDKEEISMKIQENKDLSGWTPITLRELMEMKPEELTKLKSYCWHDGDPRCDCIGIRDLKVENRNEKYDVFFSDSNGDPRIYGISIDEKINNLGNGEWNYGLYRKKKKDGNITRRSKKKQTSKA